MNTHQDKTRCPRQPVESSSLTSVAYDLESHILEVEFRKGGVYCYYGVPAFVHRALMEASSKGKFFVMEVRDRFSYARVSNPTLA